MEFYLEGKATVNIKQIWLHIGISLEKQMSKSVLFPQNCAYFWSRNQYFLYVYCVQMHTLTLYAQPYSGLV